jgi:hypothetical protein
VRLLLISQLSICRPRSLKVLPLHHIDNGSLGGRQLLLFIIVARHYRFWAPFSDKYKNVLSVYQQQLSSSSNEPMNEVAALCSNKQVCIDACAVCAPIFSISRPDVVVARDLFTCF